MIPLFLNVIAFGYNILKMHIKKSFYYPTICKFKRDMNYFYIWIVIIHSFFVIIQHARYKVIHILELYGGFSTFLNYLLIFEENVKEGIAMNEVE